MQQQQEVSTRQAQQSAEVASITAQREREAQQARPKRPRIDAASTRQAGILREALNRHAQALYDGMPRAEQQACKALFRAIAAGREGDAVQIGAVFSYFAGKKLPFKTDDL